MTRKDGSLALLVVVVWGLNFVVIKLIANMPPLMLAGLRFMLVAFRRCCLSPGRPFRCACCWAMA